MKTDVLFLSDLSKYTFPWSIPKLKSLLFVNPQMQMY